MELDSIAVYSGGAVGSDGFEFVILCSVVVYLGGAAAGSAGTEFEKLDSVVVYLGGAAFGSVAGSVKFDSIVVVVVLVTALVTRDDRLVALGRFFVISSTILTQTTIPQQIRGPKITTANTMTA